MFFLGVDMSVSEWTAKPDQAAMTSSSVRIIAKKPVSTKTIVFWGIPETGQQAIWLVIESIGLKSFRSFHATNSEKNLPTWFFTKNWTK
jgi:hypothetical protein